MRKTVLVHGAWLVVAIASFVLGARVFPSAGDPVDDPAESPMRGRGPDGRTAGVAGVSGFRPEGRPAAGGRRERSDDKGPAEMVLSEQDIRELGEQFREASSPIDRRLTFSRLLEGLTAENALQIREQVAHLHHHSPEFREFHYAWGAVGGVDAVLFGADTKEDDMSPALAGWASANPNLALAWFEELDMENDARFDPLLKDRKIPAENLRNHLMGGLVHGLAAVDPDAASRFVHAMAAAGNGRAEDMMHVVVGAVMRTDSPAEAAVWAESLPAGDLRIEAMERVADHYAGSDPEAAAAWAEQFGNEPGSAGIVAEVASNWAAGNPEAAVSWVNGLPEGTGRTAGMHQAMREWAEHDPVDAGEYLQKLPSSPLRDAGVGGYSRRIAWENPQTAMDWAESISSEEPRLEAMIGVGRAWTRKDANGAAEWVRDSGLPDEVQKAILNPPRWDRK